MRFLKTKDPVPHVFGDPYGEAKKGRTEWLYGKSTNSLSLPGQIAALWKSIFEIKERLDRLEGKPEKLPQDPFDYSKQIQP